MMDDILDKREIIDEVEIKAAPSDIGMRLDVFMAARDEDLSRSYAQKLIEEGMVSINGEVQTSKKYRMAADDSVAISIPEPTVLDASPQDIPIEIVYEDSDLIVVNKPCGMVVHPSAGNHDGTLVNALMYHCGGSLSSINGEIRPGIVHRIDKDTSGLLVVAKNDRAHESLAAQLREHSMTREYRALVYDNIKEDELTIDEPIGRDERNRLRRGVNGSNPKEAVTHIRVMERFGRYTLIAARLETGRTHQIRVHMAYIKHPLVGDALYGPPKAPFETYGQMLHAKTIGFVHPRTGEYMEFDSELPEYFEKILQKLRSEKNV